MKTTILIHEWVTGGGLAGAHIPASLAAEGAAMRRAITRDFAAVDAADVVVTLDARLADDPGPWSTVRVGPAQAPDWLTQLARGAHYILLIAPETGGVLLEQTELLATTEARCLGSDAEAVRVTGDKWEFHTRMADCGIATPEAVRVRPGDGLPKSFPYPAVLKPVDGAGTIDTFLVSEANVVPTPWLRRPEALLQSFVPGVPMSASFLVDSRGTPHLLGVGVQRITVNKGRFCYMGGTLPAPRHLGEGAPRRAVESVRGLRGFVGVDFVWSEESGEPVVLEINSRPTTSYVGLAEIFGPGRVAGAWLHCLDGDTAELPLIADRTTPGERLAFDPDGTVYRERIGGAAC
jgi:predicted ATP-grasp superfamily ATP-dependent carboligase